MRASVYVRILMFIKILDPVYHAGRLLRCSGVIKPDELPAVYLFGKDGKILSDRTGTRYIRKSSGMSVKRRNTRKG
jgi:hypothetical protein